MAALASRRLLVRLAALVLPLYAVLTLPGPGLHLLIDCGHTAEVGEGDHGGRDGVPGDPSHPCPVCQLTAQGQFIQAATVVPVDETVAPLIAEEKPEAPAPAVCRSAHPRAPPAA